jgi:RNA polymerase sigma factor for flagellar operon FliA
MNVEDRLAQEQAVARLREAVSALPDREREIIERYDLEGWTLRQIGEGLGVSESRVSQLRSRALVRLRQAMEGRRVAA